MPASVAPEDAAFLLCLLAENRVKGVAWQRHLKLYPGLYYSWTFKSERWQTGIEHESRNSYYLEMQCVPQTACSIRFCGTSLFAEAVLSRKAIQRVTRAGMTPAALVCMPVCHAVHVANGHKHIRNLCLLHYRHVHTFSCWIHCSHILAWKRLVKHTLLV